MENEIQLFDAPDITALDFCSLGWLKSEVYKMKVDTADELLARIVDTAGSIKRSEDQLKRTTCDLHTRVVKCVEVGGGIWECLL